MVVRHPIRKPPVLDGTSREDLAIFLRGWRRYRAWAVREEPAVYDARLAPLLARLEAHLAALREYAALPPEAFLSNTHIAPAAQHDLFLAFAGAIDTTKWLAGKVRLRGRPRGLAEAFDLLVEAGALPSGKRNVLIGMARLRNWIAHEAVSLPPAKVRALVRFYRPELEAYAAWLRRGV